jgi:hypothetical protein
VFPLFFFSLFSLHFPLSTPLFILSKNIPSEFLLGPSAVVFTKEKKKQKKPPERKGGKMLRSQKATLTLGRTLLLRRAFSTEVTESKQPSKSKGPYKFLRPERKYPNFDKWTIQYAFETDSHPKVLKAYIPEGQKMLTADEIYNFLADDRVDLRNVQNVRYTPKAKTFRHRDKFGEVKFVMQRFFPFAGVSKKTMEAFYECQRKA